MHLNLRRFLTVFLMLALVILCLHPDVAEAARRKKSARRAPPDRFAEIVVDAATGRVIREKNADKRLYPASLTKMMTLYLAFDALDNGRLTRGQRIRVSKHAAAQEPSSLGLRPGEAIRVEDAILAIATKSANDCAVALAEAVGGTEEAFARAMTAKARQLGMMNTRFVNASGLFRPAQVSSARDMAILSRALIHDHPRHYHYFSTDSFTYEGNTYRNHNKLMSSYRGMDGLKTGYVYASGYNLAASAVRNGRRLIGVIFGGRTAQSRNAAMARLLNDGFARASSPQVASIAATLPPAAAPRPKPASLPVAAEVAAVTPASGVAAALAPVPVSSVAVDQGDTDAGEDSAPKSFAAALQPQPVRIATPQKGPWAVQIGAFSSHAAGMKALQLAKRNLRGNPLGTESISPLMTPRGMVYRARLAGFARQDAAQACQILKGNCIVLAVE